MLFLNKDTLPMHVHYCQHRICGRAEWSPVCFPVGASTIVIDKGDYQRLTPNLFHPVESISFSEDGPIEFDCNNDKRDIDKNASFKTISEFKPASNNVA